jgi:hypothetical protein
MTRIRFDRRLGLEVFRYTSLHNIEVGPLWCVAWATDSDLETFRLNDWSFVPA